MSAQSGMPLLEELRRVWALTTNAQATIEDGDTFAGVGGDSIAATLCLIELEERFDVVIDQAWLLDDVTTLRDLCERVRELQAPA
jgi:acyl carrier protein